MIERRQFARPLVRVDDSPGQDLDIVVEVHLRGRDGVRQQTRTQVPPSKGLQVELILQL